VSLDFGSIIDCEMSDIHLQLETIFIALDYRNRKSDTKTSNNIDYMNTSIMLD